MQVTIREAAYRAARAAVPRWCPESVPDQFLIRDFLAARDAAEAILRGALPPGSMVAMRRGSGYTPLYRAAREAAEKAVS